MKAVSRSYDSYVQACAAVDAIEKAGVPSADVSLIAPEHVVAGSANGKAIADTATAAGIGGLVGGSAGLLAGLGLLAIPGLGPVIAAGWLAAAAVGAAAGATTGGLVGALIDAGLDDAQAASLSESVRRGSTLVTVRVPDGEVGRVEGLLSIHRAADTATPVDRPGESERERKLREWRDEGMGKQA